MCALSMHILTILKIVIDPTHIPEPIAQLLGDRLELMLAPCLIPSEGSVDLLSSRLLISTDLSAVRVGMRLVYLDPSPAPITKLMPWL